MVDMLVRVSIETGLDKTDPKAQVSACLLELFETHVRSFISAKIRPVQKMRETLLWHPDVARFVEVNEQILHKVFNYLHENRKVYDVISDVLSTEEMFLLNDLCDFKLTRQ
jgi:hypothetical protein